MLKWSFKREAHWMLWMLLPLPLLGIAAMLWSWLERMR